MSLLFTSEQQALFESLLQARRDVRGNHFLCDEPVSDDEIQRILQAAIWAPSVGYSQPWRFVVIRDDQVKQQVAHSFKQENEKAAHLFDEKQQQYQQLKLEGILEAPVNIAVFYEPSTAPVLGQTSMQEMGEYSVVCAVQNMWLMARSMNIGIGWVSILNPEDVKSILSAPKDNKLVAYLCVGKVDEFLNRPELEQLKWDKAKTLESVVSYNRF
ncbi:5,6-dimethylbenzimidazole synthase [Bermanella sp. WJH001]|uniref:5,6-dimethylbenzimidazole synthase n=1 Tax=Bermanella sp. WJH001 TaxID=3048005 RepID=UPI0024BD8B91|nr:5,6-dimethylbenzimidazole synthase [Bermanella sp. WJH001]MDJ1539314.1 5,6-dimethylbenzimidazole synthase [Bermanella sp. WJH001]